jgi:hypothetical protein
VRRIFDGAGLRPSYQEPPELIPTNRWRSPDAVSVSVDVGFADDVRRVVLAGGHRMRYELVRRADAGSAVSRAFAAFALGHAPQA